MKLSDFTGVLWNSLEPVTNLSMLSGIQNTISAAKYSSASETLASIGEDIALSYAMQGIPSLAGSISRTTLPQPFSADFAALICASTSLSISLCPEDLKNRQPSKTAAEAF